MRTEGFARTEHKKNQQCSFSKLARSIIFFDFSDFSVPFYMNKSRCTEQTNLFVLSSQLAVTCPTALWLDSIQFTRFHCSFQWIFSGDKWQKMTVTLLKQYFACTSSSSPYGTLNNKKIFTIFHVCQLLII